MPRYTHIMRDCRCGNRFYFSCLCLVIDIDLYRDLREHSHSPPPAALLPKCLLRRCIDLRLRAGTGIPLVRLRRPDMRLVFNRKRLIRPRKLGGRNFLACCCRQLRHYFHPFAFGFVALLALLGCEVAFVTLPPFLDIALPPLVFMPIGFSPPCDGEPPRPDNNPGLLVFIAQFPLPVEPLLFWMPRAFP